MMTTTTPPPPPTQTASRPATATNDKLLLEEASGLLVLEGVPQHVRLTTQALFLRPLATSQTRQGEVVEGSHGGFRHVDMADTIGARLEVIPGEEEGKSPRVVMEVYSYPVKSPMACFCHTTRPQHITLQVLSKEVGSAIVESIRGLVGRPHFPRRLIVFVNPKSGRGHGPEIYTNTVKPMLDQAGIPHILFTTKHRGDAKQWLIALREEEAAEGLGVVSVGGDGLLSEIVDGLYERDPKGLKSIRTIPLGVIKAGTGNGLAASILDENGESFDVVNSTFLVIKGRPRPIDLSCVQTCKGHQHLCFLMLSWGLFSDIHLGSPALGLDGPTRHWLWGTWCIWRRKTYKGTFSYLPAKSGGEDTTASDEMVALPPLDQPLPEGQGWVTINDGFVMVLVCHVPYIAEDVPVFRGKATLGGGGLHVLVIRKHVSRLKLIRWFTAMSRGHHFRDKDAELLKVRAYRLVPHTPGGIYNLNGEYIDYGPVQATILPRCCYVFSTLSSIPVARRFEEEKYEETSVVAVGGDEETEEDETDSAAGAAAVTVQDDQDTVGGNKQLSTSGVDREEQEQEGDATAQ